MRILKPLSKNTSSGLSANSSSSSELVQGQHIAPADGANKAFKLLYEKGIKLLAMREHSIKEIQQKLSSSKQSGEFVEELVEEVITRLIEENYLSEQRFTESYIRSRGNRGVGPIKIANELRNKGISAVLIDEYLNPNAAQWYENAKQQYCKKFLEKAISDYKEWVKRARFLQGRGFNMEHIHSVIPPVDLD